MSVLTASWTDLIRDGDLVVVAQGVGEPTPLLQELLALDARDIEVFVGLSHSRALDRPTALPLLSFGAMGPLNRPPHRGSVGVIPAHYDDLPRLLPLRGRDLVLLMQVTTPDAYGNHNLGMAVDYTYELLSQARLVLAEVNSQLPVTSAPCLPGSAFGVTIQTSRPLVEVPGPRVEETHRCIAALIAKLIPNGSTIQLGIGSVSAALGHALGAHRELAVRSTLVGDWLLELVQAGAVRRGTDAIVISEAAGSPALYEHIATSADVRLRPVRDVIGPAARGEVDGFVAVNSALQVDVSGQVNAEEIPSRYVGGIGGQAEFLRAAQRSRGGLSVIALPAMAGARSRIVRNLSPSAVTTARSGVDLVVTEYGVADLRGRALRERAALITAIAAPEHRAALEREMD